MACFWDLLLQKSLTKMMCGLAPCCLHSCIRPRNCFSNSLCCCSDSLVSMQSAKHPSDSTVIFQGNNRNRLRRTSDLGTVSEEADSFVGNASSSRSGESCSSAERTLSSSGDFCWPESVDSSARMRQKDLVLSLLDPYRLSPLHQEP